MNRALVPLRCVWIAACLGCQSPRLGAAKPVISAPVIAQGSTEASPSEPSTLEQKAVVKDQERARRRYEEMLAKMTAAVDDIAAAYGSPSFLQVFTNDPERADALKARLAAAGSDGTVRKEIEALKKEREDLLNDIALRQRESRRLTEKLSRQRMAMDALASAAAQAREVLEASVP